MAENRNVVVEDEEIGNGGNKIQPFASTLKPKQLKMEIKKQKSSTWSKVLGLQDLVSLDVWRASVAELVGSGVLVFAIDTIVISSYETQTKTPNLIMSLWISFAVAITLLATFPISGGHVNPVITLGAFLSGLVSVSRAVVYVVAQCAGSTLGALALKAVVDGSIEQTFSLGGCTLNIVVPGADGPVAIGLDTSRAFWLEIICTFILMFSLYMAFDQRQAEKLGRVVICAIIGLVVGLLVFVSTTLTATKGYSGAGMNPARCLGPALIRGGHLWNGHWVFWAGPAIACVAYFIYIRIIPGELLHA